jgi:hypothetical protein
MDKKTIALVLLGIALILAGLWGGSWLLVHFPLNSGYSFASFITGFVICGMGGCCLFLAANKE